ncbi:hypothetical protein, partial [Parabacteroides distasonis]
NGYKILSFQTYKAVCLIPQVYRVSRDYLSPIIVTHRLHIPIKIEPPIQMFIIKNPIVIRLLTGLAFITIETGKKKSRSY